MAPKKGGKGKGKSKGKKGGEKGEKDPNKKKLVKVADGLSLSEMTAGQIMAQIKKLVGEKDREVEETQLFFLERKKLYAMWNLVMDKVKIMKDEASNSRTQLDQTEKKRNQEASYQSTKLRQLKNEETKNLGTIRLHHLNYMKHLSDEMWEMVNILRESAIGKRAHVRKELSSQYEILRGLHSKHVQSVSELGMTFSQSIRNKEITSERTFESRHDASTAVFSQKSSQLQGHKFNILDSMYGVHERALLEIQTYFNDMTANNFSVMHSIHEEIEVLIMTNSRLIRQLKDVKRLYVAADVPLTQMVHQLGIMSDKAQSYEEFFEKSLQLNSVLSEKRCSISQLELLIEILIQQIDVAKKDGDQVRRRFSKGLLKIQSQVSMVSLINKLKSQTATKDAALLQAINVLKKTGSMDALAVLHADLDHHRSRLRTNVDKLEVDEEAFRNNCLNPKMVDAAMREYGSGLQNKTGCIPLPHDSQGDMPMDAPKKWLRRFQGRGQGIQTQIRYFGFGRQEDPGGTRNGTRTTGQCGNNRVSFNSKTMTQTSSSTSTGQNSKSIPTTQKTEARKKDLCYGYYLLPSQSSSDTTFTLPPSMKTVGSNYRVKSNTKSSLKLPPICSTSTTQAGFRPPSVSPSVAATAYALPPTIAPSFTPMSMSRSRVTSVPVPIVSILKTKLNNSKILSSTSRMSSAVAFDFVNRMGNGGKIGSVSRPSQVRVQIQQLEVQE